MWVKNFAVGSSPQLVQAEVLPRIPSASVLASHRALPVASWAAASRCSAACQRTPVQAPCLTCTAIASGTVTCACASV
jgi:hypothetical protein